MLPRPRRGRRLSPIISRKLYFIQMFMGSWPAISSIWLDLGGKVLTGLGIRYPAGGGRLLIVE
jgi:hypothetical protein